MEEAAMTIQTVITDFQSVLTGAGTGIMGFVDAVIDSPVLLVTCVLMPIALTLGSFALGMLRR